MKNRTSGTAEGVAYMRYFESKRPKNMRICNDYLALSLSAWWVKAAAGITGVLPRTFMDRALERKGKGVSGFMAVRTRLFDDYLLESVRKGAKQYVVFGAGLDSRAYRFEKELAGIKVFEVDHPLTQAVKKKRVIKLLGRLPEDVRYVPVDFTKDDLLKKLQSAGYDPSLKTVFTFEGVTMYLDAASVKETLLFVLNRSGAGSCMMFDYIYKEVLEGKMESRVVNRMNRYRSTFGEPVTYGIGMGKAEHFILEIGFDWAEDYTPEMLYEKYILPVAPGRAISGNYAIALAGKD